MNGQPPADSTQRFIETLPIFQGLSSREKSTLTAILTTRVYKPGAILCREGDRAFTFFILARGTVEVFKELPGGKREKLGQLTDGSMIGQVSLIDGKPRSATVQARTQAVCLECTRDDFERMFTAGSPFAFKILDQIVIHLTKRLRDANHQLYNLYSRPTETLLKLHAACLNIERTLNDTHDSSDGANVYHVSE